MPRPQPCEWKDRASTSTLQPPGNGRWVCREADCSVSGVHTNRQAGRQTDPLRVNTSGYTYGHTGGKAQACSCMRTHMDIHAAKRHTHADKAHFVVEDIPRQIFSIFFQIFSNFLTNMPVLFFFR
ncbi:unnamed protein product, partial [Discosporangium mesarthrocarpum]